MTERALAIDYYEIDSTQIRILILQRGVADDEVVCALVPVNRRDEAEYHALSYEWGAESKDDPDITVHDRKVQIRRNLFDALRSIRKPMEDQLLWVDAICINQSNVQEKSQQVSMMGETFKRAVGVISWLGPAKDDSDLAMDLLSNKASLEAKLPSLDRDSRELKALVSLCHRRYWRRVWIIQELYLAKSYVVWCGAKSIPESEFDKSVATLNGASNAHYKDFIDNPANHHREARLFSSADWINNLRRWIHVCLRGNFECSREHDFIYALLDISEDYAKAPWSLRVDYSKTPREVFLQLLEQRSLAKWVAGDQCRLLELAEKMNLDMDEGLRRSISDLFVG
ncbi:heterokaryon incompatibility 6 OR allele [Fusarium pseudoanthophilum]|uniref:Heterokaryon incompatibility 6 OR allele n=1 Tax=Fusarium pseudoanthophilum TaxID=48495 RepID=A0A8H5P2M1_9HYPO|nr:heterokaryon incompatibility 6 OR allele [Fusarium pseudoanthophilum]